VARLYPSFAGNPDYTTIVNERHYQRLAGLIDDARAKGARIVTLGGAADTSDPASRRMPPTLVLAPTIDGCDARGNLRAHPPGRALRRSTRRSRRSARGRGRCRSIISATTRRIATARCAKRSQAG
jgi:hypothetical protein